MARKSNKNHVHQYQRTVLGKDYVIFRCVLPDCNHYVPENLVVGKECICNRCKRTKFVIKKGHDGRVLHKPHCQPCTTEPRNPAWRKAAREAKNEPVAEDFVERLLSGNKP